MDNVLVYLKFALAAIGGVLGVMFGALDKMLIVLIIVAVLDYISGVLGAIYLQKVNSAIGYRGIIKKVGMFLMVAVAHLLDQVCGTDFIRYAVIAFYIANEGISIMENCGKMGLPLPAVIKKALEQLKSKGEGTDQPSQK